MLPAPSLISAPVVACPQLVGGSLTSTCINTIEQSYATIKKVSLPFLILFITLSFFSSVLFAQKDSFDLVIYKPLDKWQKLLKETVVTYTSVDKKDKSWGQVSVYKSVPSKGSIEADFESEWNDLAAKPFKISETPTKSEVAEADGWKIVSGSGKFIFNDSAAAIIVTTFSGHNRCISIVATTANQRYLQEFDQFFGSIDLKHPADVTAVIENAGVANSTSENKFTFTNTNFDDGWVSTAKENWVEVSKGDIKVLLHYPDKNADAYNAVLKTADLNAWNILVSPRYSNIKNFEWKTIQSWQSISFMEADATEQATGKNVHVVFFKKHYSTGNGKYLEFVTAGKTVYENEFGPYHNTEFDWDKVANMQFRNKFAVASSDLIGKWSTTDYASVSYYYVNTGGLAGTTATSTADEFTFMDGNNYQSQHSGASGMVGNMKFSNQIYKGKSTVSNWHLVLTNRFEGATEKYDCRFEAIKDGRVLLMTDRLGTTHSLVKSK